MIVPTIGLRYFSDSVRVYAPIAIPTITQGASLNNFPAALCFRQ